MYLTIIFLSTALVSSNLAEGSFSGKFALPGRMSEVNRTILPNQGGKLLYYHRKQAVIVRNQCDIRKALWMGSVLAHTDNLFQDAATPIIYGGEDELLSYEVTSAQFINGPLLSIVFVIAGQPFVYFPSTNSWVTAKGVSQQVTEASVLQCCFETMDSGCMSYNNAVLLYGVGSLVEDRQVYFSMDGGLTYRRFHVATSHWERLRGIYLTVSSIVAVVADEGNMFYIRKAFGVSKVSESYPLQDRVVDIRVMQVPGFMGHLIIWAPHMLLYSPNDGRVILPVFEKGKDNSTVPPPDVTVWTVRAAGTGVIAVVTSDGGVYYGRLSLKAVVIKFSRNIYNHINTDLSIFFNEHWDLFMVSPKIDTVGHRIVFQLLPIGVQEQLTQTSHPVISCPIERFSGHFDGKVFYIDNGGSVKLTLVYVPTPLCPFFPVVTSTVDLVKTDEIFVHNGVTPEGYKTFIMEIGIRLQSTFLVEVQGGALATISVDLMEREVACNDLNPQILIHPGSGSHSVQLRQLDFFLSLKTFHFPSRKLPQKAYVIIGCPPGKHIRVMRTQTACTRGKLTPEQLQDNFTYTIPKEVYDPAGLFRPNMAEKDQEVVYSYMDHLCPLLVHYDMPWRPTLELWDGDTFVEVVKADFVMFEENGMLNYKYSQTAKKAKCVSQPQDWISMLASQSVQDIYSAWTRHNYKSCKDYDGPYLTNPDAEYQVLNKDSRNRILFQNYNGMYMFTATVVDPHYSFCSLQTTFSVYVYGAFPKRILPPVVPTALFIGIFSTLLLTAYFLRRNTSRKIC